MSYARTGVGPTPAERSSTEYSGSQNATGDGVMRNPSIVAALCSVILGLAACEKQGPGERIGEEVDEAADTLKHGGRESTANKVDDAVDEVREGAREAADEIKDK